MIRGLTPLRVKCKQDLFMAHTHSKSFTKENVYESDGYINYYSPTSVPETLVVIDDQGDKHSLGCWAKHFKIVK